MSEKNMLEISSKIEVDDDFEQMKEHQLWEKAINEVRQLFYDKNHDYCSSWRVEDENSIARELFQRVVRIIRLLQLEQEGKKSKVADGIYDEFRDMINWCIFGMLVNRGYGWAIQDLMIADSPDKFVQNQEPRSPASNDFGNVTRIIDEYLASRHGASPESIDQPIQTNFNSLSNLVEISSNLREHSYHNDAEKIATSRGAMFQGVEMPKPSQCAVESFGDSYIPVNIVQSGALPGETLNRMKAELHKLASHNDRMSIAESTTLLLDPGNILSSLPSFFLHGIAFKRADILDANLALELSKNISDIVFIKVNRSEIE